MKVIALTALTALTVSVAAMPAGATAITYKGSAVEGGISADYSITTDGSLGYVSAIDVTAFTVALSSADNAYSYDQSDAGFDNFGALYFTASTIQVDLQQGGSEAFLYAQNSSDVEIDEISDYRLDLVANGRYESKTGPGSPTFATAVSAAPEPSTWLLMFAGIGGIGLLLGRAKKTMSFRFKDATCRSPSPAASCSST